MIRMIRLNRNLKVLFVINLAISLCFGLVSPLFPLFIDGLGASVIEISLVLFVGGVAATILRFHLDCSQTDTVEETSLF